MWNGFSMISKQPELTEGMMQTLVEAERTLLESPGNLACPKSTEENNKQTWLRTILITAYLIHSLQKMNM